MPRTATPSCGPEPGDDRLTTFFEATLGIALPTFPSSGEPSIQRVIDTAQLAEDHGYERLWTWDHVVWPRPQLDCVVATAVALSSTARISAGPGVMQLPLRSAPLVAHQVGGLAAGYPGRVHLGVGAGQSRAEFRSLGADFRNRWATTEARLAEVHEWWRNQSGLEPAQPQVWIGGRSADALRLAAEQGGWIPAFARAEQLAAGLQTITALPEFDAARMWRFAAVLPLGPLGDVEAGCRWLAKLFGLPSYPRSLVLGGTSGSVSADLREFIDVGVSHVCLVVADDDPIPTMRWVQHELGLHSTADGGSQ